MVTKAKPGVSSPMVQRLPITQARIHLGSIVKRAHFNKEYFVLEKDGIPIAGLMGIDEFEDFLELKDPKVREHIRKSYQDYLAGKHRPLTEFIAELEGERRAKPKRRRQ